MGLGDTFKFDEARYAREICCEKNYNHGELRKREIVKYRQQISASFAIGAGIGAAAPTLGLSLLGTMYGWRRMYIAKKKLEMVEAELRKRGIALYVVRKRDWFIPVGIGIVTLGLGFGLEVIALSATTPMAGQLVADHGMQCISDVAADPANAAEGFVEGVNIQFHEIANVATGGMDHAAAVADWDSSYIAANAGYFNPAEVIGVAAGLATATVLEVKLAQFVAGHIAIESVDSMTCNRSQAYTWALPEEKCRRREDRPMRIQCGFCSSIIPTTDSSYFHCCECTEASTSSKDDWDSCEDCILLSGKSCDSKDKHLLYRISPNDEKASCSRMSSMFREFKCAPLHCGTCLANIEKEDYYHCCACTEDDFDICQKCHDDGKRCLDSTHGYMTKIPEPRTHWQVNVITASLPDSCNRKDRDPSMFIDCDACKNGFQPSATPYLHCCSCNDNYDVCMSCTMNGARCHDSEHEMHLVKS